jgi:hypothetical protein
MSYHRPPSHTSAPAGNTTAYVTQPRGSAGLTCYTNRSDPAGAVIETIAPARTPDA